MDPPVLDSINLELIGISQGLYGKTWVNFRAWNCIVLHKVLCLAEQNGKRGNFKLFIKGHTEQRQRHDDRPRKTFEQSHLTGRRVQLDSQTKQATVLMHGASYNVEPPNKAVIAGQIDFGNGDSKGGIVYFA